jgi:hypothetical protein
VSLDEERTLSVLALDVQKVIDRLNVLRGRQLPPAPALALAIAAGLAGAGILTFILEALASVHWWTAIFYMAAFFGIAVVTYRRVSPEGTHFALTGGRRYLEESGTLDLIDAARFLSSRTTAKGRPTGGPSPQLLKRF